MGPMSRSRMRSMAQRAEAAFSQFPVGIFGNPLQSNPAGDFGGSVRPTSRDGRNGQRESHSARPLGHFPGVTPPPPAPGVSQPANAKPSPKTYPEYVPVVVSSHQQIYPRTLPEEEPVTHLDIIETASTTSDGTSHLEDPEYRGERITLMGRVCLLQYLSSRS